MTKKVALYVRVSTGHQSSGLESQIRSLLDYCKRKEITNYLIYEDENQSGTKNSRPALNRLMKDAAQGELEAVIVYSFSRYARSVTHLLRALEEFKQLGVKFVSVSEDLDTETPIGKALFTILGSVAQLERDILAERVRNGLVNARAKGVKIGRTKTRDSALIRKLRSNGMTFQQIAKIANCSVGSVGAEIKSMKLEQELLVQKERDADQSLLKFDIGDWLIPPITTDYEVSNEEWKEKSERSETKVLDEVKKK